MPARAQMPVRPASSRFAAPGTPLAAPSAPSVAPPAGAASTGPPAGQVSGMPGAAASGDSRLTGTDVRMIGADGRILGPDGRVVYPPPLEQPLDPDTYRVDKGDVLQARVWGDQNFDIPLPVDPDGRLFIPRVGYVTAHARTLTDVTDEVVRRLQGRFPKLRVAVTLATPRTFLVRVTGAVGNPGAGIPVNAWTRASEAVERAGGVSAGGSRRRIELHHGATSGDAAATGRTGAAAGMAVAASAGAAGGVGTGKVEPVDLLLFPLFGDRTKDPVLLDGDWLHVPLAARAVTVTGGVNRPGTYELFEGSFRELLQLAGGLSPEADDRLGIRVDSVEGDTRRVQLLAYRHDPPRGHRRRAPPPRHRDHPHPLRGRARGDQGGRWARSWTRRRAWIRVSPIRAPPSARSACRSPSSPARPSAESSARRAAWRRTPTSANAFIERREVTAAGPAGATAAQKGRDSGGRTTQRIPIDLVAIFTESNRDKDVALNAGDTVYVPSMRTDVVVSGYVMKPGVYGYSLRLTGADYLSLAGGETRDGARGRARVVSLDGKTRSLNDTVRLQPGDSIVVPGKRITTAEWVSISLGVISIGLSAVLLGYNLAR